MSLWSLIDREVRHWPPFGGDRPKDHGGERHGKREPTELQKRRCRSVRVPHTVDNPLVSVFSSGQNVLVSPSKWEDPFEDLIAKSQVLLANGRSLNLRDFGVFFGQCWTLHNASDAMWRIYSSDSQSVRIRTTVRKLAESLCDNVSESAQANCFIGRVRYLTEKELLNFARNSLVEGLLPSHLAKTLLIKRKAFRHERELRLLFFEQKGSQTDNGLFRYKADPHLMIDQIMMAPRLPAGEARKLKQEIRSRTKFRGSIKRSLLYAPPDQMIFHVR